MEMGAGEVVVLEELSGGQLLDHAAHLAETRNRCEVEILRAAVQHAYLNSPETLDPADAARPGRERARRLGGPGTPQVTEFAAAELGARLGLSTVSAGLLMADGLDICHRLPRLWARVESGQVRVYLARLVARRTRDLTPDQADEVDQRVSEHADGRLTYTRFERLVDAAVAAADLAATRQREEQAARAQWARPTRPDHAAQLITAYQAWRDRPDHPPDLPDLPGEATGDARPRTGAKPIVDWPTLLPRVTVHTHVYTGTLDRPETTDPDRVVRVEGCGAMSLAWVRTHLTHAAQVTIRPVLDLEGLAPVDAYEIPDRHRQAVRVMTPADTFPYATSLHPDQLDHTEAYQHGPDAAGAGQSRIGNYGPMTTTHHRLKTHGRWRVKQPFPGIYLWRDPHGTTYLVDHTGTRALTKAA